MTGDFDRDDWRDTPHEPPVRRWTREEAQALRAKHPPLSPWRVIAVQAVVGLLCAAIAWGFTQRGAAMWSALYGAAAVVLPGVLLARGMTKSASNPVAAAAGFMFWEFLKIAAAIVMLVIAAQVVPDLSWPALLASMVVCMKVNWFALLWRGR